MLIIYPSVQKRWRKRKWEERTINIIQISTSFASFRNRFMTKLINNNSYPITICKRVSMKRWKMYWIRNISLPTLTHKERKILLWRNTHTEKTLTAHFLLIAISKNTPTQARGLLELNLQFWKSLLLKRIFHLMFKGLCTRDCWKVLDQPYCQNLT